MALGLGAGSESRRGLGYAIVGGVLFSTALTLFLVPTVYALLDSLRHRAQAPVPDLSRPVPEGGVEAR